jgi:hypothetical protein
MRLPKAACLTVVVMLFLGAARKPYVDGMLVDVQQKATTRVLYYQVDTPITRDDPYYEVAVQIKDTVYFGRYTPMHASDTLPEAWTVGSTVKARIDGNHLVLQRPTGGEMSFAFTKRPVVKPAASSAAPASK